MEKEETQVDRAIQKLKENPFIPIGFFATCGALGMAFRKMQQRDSEGYQRWLRARVVAQGLTIVAIVVAGVNEWDKFSPKKAAPVSSAAASDSVAFQKRLREAEDAHNEERMSSQNPIPEGQPPISNTKSTTQTRTRDSWLAWLRLSK